MINARVRKITVAGALSAVVFILQVTGLGLIPLPIASFTIMHVPVIIGAIIEGPVVGVFIGLLFGIFSLIRAATTAVTPFDLAFVNPFISVLPRLFIGPAAWLIYRLINGKENGGATNSGSIAVESTVGSALTVVRKCAAIIAGAVTGSMTNTVLVLSALAISGILPVPDGQTAWQVIIAVAAFNGLLEAGIAAAIALAVIAAWQKIALGGKPKLVR
ncbi:MAG: ECF transporter S component [Spirochaetaceae bacterium]|jgi:uncharacterized membrane protein|nr:ECF transporter S component [Spirochaetaceae bacterium]